MYGICELLVSRRVTRKIVLTRLPVGHTHEDVDALFGNLWNSIHGQCLFTPDEYRRALEHALAIRSIDVHVREIFCVPDYQQWILQHMGNLERYAQGVWSQLQWIFEAYDHCFQGCKCPKCLAYPSNVKVNYRR